MVAAAGRVILDIAANAPILHGPRVSISQPHLEQPSQVEPAVRAGTATIGDLAPRRLSAETTVTVVVPCYNEQAVLPQLFARLGKAADEWGTRFEAVLVDDGSTDDTWPMLLAQHQRDGRWKAVRLARNFGHQLALRAGLQAARGDVVAVIDADLQDPPEALAEFLAKWAEGHDVIYGVRRKRRESWLKRTAYFAFYRLLSRLAEVDMPLDAGDFCVMDRRVVDLIRAMPERRPFIRGLRSWVGFRQLAYPYDRQPRAAGQTHYSVRRLMGLAMDGILSSSILPLRLATVLGLAISFFSFLGAALVLLMKLLPGFFARFGLAAIPGTALISISILFFGGVQLVVLGILGEYIGRIYENVKGRPLWTVCQYAGVEPRHAEGSGDRTQW